MQIFHARHVHNGPVRDQLASFLSPSLSTRYVNYGISYPSASQALLFSNPLVLTTLKVRFRVVGCNFSAFDSTDAGQVPVLIDLPRFA